MGPCENANNPVTEQWLITNGWNKRHRMSVYWSHKNVPLVWIICCDDALSPELRLECGYDWVIITKTATTQDVIDLVAAMKCSMYL
jgi:hypothetical protein